jgi:mono/diheme cytochrome c family protein
MRGTRVLVAAIAAHFLSCSGVAAVAADGAKIFAGTCQACHQAGGVGTPGLAPPLVSPIIANAANKRKDYPVMVVMNGLSGPISLSGGGVIVSAMPPQQSLTDEDIAAVVTYVYGLNHVKTVVNPSDVATARTQSGGHDELKRIRSGLAQ